MRLFVALSVPEAVKAAYAPVGEALRALLPKSSLRLVAPESMHLTLRFLGDVNERDVPALSDALRTALASSPALTLVAERLGTFPDLRFPRVVWGWVHDASNADSVAVSELAERVTSACTPFTQSPREERFVPHVTLARTHDIARPQAEQLAALVHAAQHTVYGAWSADAVHLVRSNFGEAPATSAPRYVDVAAFPLR